jgi:hypothetical protein
MEPEGVVHVLRHLLRSLVSGGVVVDLLAVPPPERVEAGGDVIGELDESAFFARAIPAAAGLDELVSEGMLAHEHEERFSAFVRYGNGAELAEDIEQEEYTHMPEELGRRVREVTGPCAIRVSCLVRRLRKRGE